VLLFKFIIKLFKDVFNTNLLQTHIYIYDKFKLNIIINLTSFGHLDYPHKVLTLYLQPKFTLHIVRNN
jgi:hypothetical protein